MAKAVRPIKKRVIPEGSTQVNFNIKNEALEKVETIAYEERVSKSHIYKEAVDRFIKDYEGKNGKVKVRAKKK